MQVCTRCQRPYRNSVDRLSHHGIGRCENVVGVFCVHDGYGCDTGCCGHRFYLVGEKGDEAAYDFDFGHDREELQEKLRELADKYRAPILTDRCEFKNGDSC